MVSVWVWVRNAHTAYDGFLKIGKGDGWMGRRGIGCDIVGQERVGTV